MHRFELSANLFLYAVFFRVTDLARNEYFNPQPENHDRTGRRRSAHPVAEGLGGAGKFREPSSAAFFGACRNTEEHGKRGHVGPDRLSLNPSQNRS